MSTPIKDLAALLDREDVTMCDEVGVTIQAYLDHRQNPSPAIIQAQAQEVSDALSNALANALEHDYSPASIAEFFALCRFARKGFQDFADNAA